MEGWSKVEQQLIGELLAQGLQQLVIRLRQQSAVPQPAALLPDRS